VGRRLFDLAFATLLFLVASPLFAAVALWIKLSSPGPIFFSHTRVGRGGSRFQCLKFRTMMDGASLMLDELLDKSPDLRAEFHATFKLANDPRITSAGRFLRRTSLDELPQFLNVLRGDMSIVGPRPVVPSETSRYGAAIPTVLSIRPGLTGLWQVSGRSDTSYRERIALDVEYAQSNSFLGDMRIILRTVSYMIRVSDNGAR
jgi:lipopolysaccharide/colanic/teichoic acid biosynthesis glycosyltransferase